MAHLAHMSSQNALYHWSFTLSVADKEPKDYDDVAEALRLLFARTCDAAIFQLECTWPDGGDPNPHFQGYFHLLVKERGSTLKAGVASVLPRIHFSPSSTAGIKALRDYCMKADTRMELPWCLQDKKWHQKKAWQLEDPDEEKISDEDFWPLQELPDWQQEMIEIFKGKADKRKIYWVWSDAQEQMGKTSFGLWCKWHLGANYWTFDTAEGLKFQVQRAARKRIFIVDLTRTIKESSYGKTMEDLYEALEIIKNGMVSTNKYKGGDSWFKAPHLLVLANREPDYKSLTGDRLVVTKLQPGVDNVRNDPVDFYCSESIASMDVEFEMDQEGREP